MKYDEFLSVVCIYTLLLVCLVLLEGMLAVLNLPFKENILNGREVSPKKIKGLILEEQVLVNLF